MANAKVGGTWRTIKLPYARVSGQWRPCKQMYAKVNGVWKITFDITAADPFDGTGSLNGQLTPGYAPWEVLSGTWTESGGNVSSSDASDRVAALETGLADVEVEIDRTTAATGGDGVAFWIQDQSNWWGVRAYTEEYFVPFTNFTYYPFNCTDSFRTRNISQNPSVPGTTVPGSNNIAVPGNVISPGNVLQFGFCTSTTGCTGTCCFSQVFGSNTAVPGSNNIVTPGTYQSCFYTVTYGPMSPTRNTFLASFATRTCSCSGNLNNNCSLNQGTGPTNCINGCAPTNFPGPSPFPCNRNPDNRSFANRISGCGAGCGPACGPICGPSLTPFSANFTATPCPPPVFNTTNFSNANCFCSYNAFLPTTINNNPPNYNAPNFNSPNNNAPRFTNPPNFNSPNTNAPNYNAPNNNTPTPASCTCTDGPITNNSYLSFISTNVSFPVCANNIPCSSTQPTGTLYSRSCVACPAGSPSCITSFSGANAAYYKRGEIVRKSGGTLNVVTNQDFGDVGNLYAYTSGNTIGFRQYSGSGRTGTSSNVVTYDAGPVNKGTKHGIIVTAVPYTQSYSIDRFKVNV